MKKRDVTRDAQAQSQNVLDKNDKTKQVLGFSSRMGQVGSQVYGQLS